MKIEKYNQRLLAILGTVGVLFLIVALIAFVSITLMEYNRYDYYEETGILSDDKIEALQKEHKREQVISYETPVLIDSVNSVYMIPVSHKTLNEQEDIMRLTNSYSASSGGFEPVDDRYSSSYYGNYNNLIIYNSITKDQQKLFNKRINFNQIETSHFKDDTFLIIKAAENDTYKDGVINLKDLKLLYVYSFTRNELKKVEVSGLEVYNYTFIENSKDIMIEFGVDKNDNGRFESYNEPTVIKRYSFESGELENVVDEEIDGDLQKTLEGSPK